MSEIRVGQVVRLGTFTEELKRFVGCAARVVQINGDIATVQADGLWLAWPLSVLEPEPRTVAVMAWHPTEQPGTHKDGRFVELCCGEIQGNAHTIVGRWNIDAQDRAGWYGTDGKAIEGATHWRELSPLPGRE